MRQWMFFLSFLFVAAGLHAAVFSIEPYPPATEPLNPGDSVNIASSSGFTGHVYSDGWWICIIRDIISGKSISATIICRFPAITS